MFISSYYVLQGKKHKQIINIKVCKYGTRFNTQNYLNYTTVTVFMPPLAPPF